MLTAFVNAVDLSMIDSVKVDVAIAVAVGVNIDVAAIELQDFRSEERNKAGLKHLLIE